MYVKTSYNFHSVARDFKQTISTVQSRISIKNRNIHENSRKMHHHQNQVRSFLRQIAISLELLVLLFCASNRTYRHPRRARKAHTHTRRFIRTRILATLRTRSTRTPARSHVPGNFAITARSMRRRRA